MKRQARFRVLPHRYTALALLVLAAGVLAVSPILSDVAERQLPPVGTAVSLTVSGFPDHGHAGDVFRVTAVVRNNANRPLPAVLRIDVRNTNTTLGPEDFTIYAGCGAEAVVSSRTLRYYLGWHGPLLAPNGSSFSAGTTVAALESAAGATGYWPVVAHEIHGRDPAGYAAFVAPGQDAPEGVRVSPSLALKIFAYFGMASSETPWSGDPADWILAVPFSDTWSPTDAAGPGFVMEIGPAVHGGFVFKTWAELPDGLGVPNHPGWTCGAL